MAQSDVKKKIKPALQHHVELAVQSHDTRRLSQAKVLYRRIIAADPEHPETVCLLARISYQYEKSQDTFELANRAILNDADDADAQFLRGLSAHRLGELALAIDCINRALTLKPDYAEAHAKLGDVLLARGDVEPAIASYDRALALDPQLFETHLRLAAANAQQGRLAAAIASYRNAISVEPNYSHPYSELGHLLEREGKLDEACASFQKVIALDPNDVNAHNKLGALLGRQGKLDEARASLQQALALDPNHCDAHCNLGNILLHQGKLDDASRCLRKVLALNPNHVSAYNNLGVLLERQGRLNEAFSCLQKVLALNPNHGNAWSNLGRVQLSQGRFEDAIACCRRAVAIRPDDASTYETLGRALLCKGERSEAAASYRRAIELGTTNPMISHELAALSGEDAGSIPGAVVKSLFDDYASRFETDLVGALGYSTPRLMREAVGRATRNTRRFQHALDLGCGTGLIGAHFRDIVAEIDGVDLSPKMLDQARRKQIYSRLHCEEIVAWMEHSAKEALSFDIVLSADVFIYFGNLEPVFKAIRTILADDGLFVFSVERLLQGSFELLPTRRYAHSTSYVREVASRHGFVIELSEQIDLRKEHDAVIGGTIFVLTRP